MSVSVNNTKSSIVVTDDKVTIKVSGGIGPQGEAGPQGPQGAPGAGYTLPAATTTALGGIVVGDNLTVDGNGRLSGQQGGVTVLNGQTGVITIASSGGVTASGGTITIGYVAPPVSSVAGRTGTVTLTHADITDFSAAVNDTQLSSGDGSITDVVGSLVKDIDRLHDVEVAPWQPNTSYSTINLTGQRHPWTLVEHDGIVYQLHTGHTSGSSFDATERAYWKQHTATSRVQSVAGRTGAVVLTTADVGGYVAPPVSSVAGRTGTVTLTTADIGGYVAPQVNSVAGRTGTVTLTTADIGGYVAPQVSSVAGRTGTVTLTTADIGGYVAPQVNSVAGRTGTVTLTTSDLSDFVSAASKYGPVSSVAGRTGTVTLTTSDIGGNIVNSINGITGTLSIVSGANITVTTSASSITVAGGGSGGGTNLWIPASAFIPRTTNGAGVDSVETTTNAQNFDQLTFDAATAQYADALVTMPSNWNAGTVTARFYWTGTGGSGDVVWRLAGRAFGDNVTLDSASGTAQSATDTYLSASYMHVSAATSAITIDGTPAANKPVQFTVSRDAANSSDTYSVSSRLLGVEIAYTAA